jgi:hypothetical protein
MSSRLLEKLAQAVVSRQDSNSDPLLRRQCAHAFSITYSLSNQRTFNDLRQHVADIGWVIGWVRGCFRDRLLVTQA